MTKISREDAIDLVKKANSVKHGPESSSDHTAYLLGIDAVQRLCDLAVAHSRKDAEPVAWQGRVWYMEPDNCWSSWRDIPDSDLPFWRERITAGSKRELRALFTHPPEASKPVMTKNQALNIQRFADEFGYDYGKLSIVVANVGFAPGEGPPNEAVKLLQQALDVLDEALGMQGGVVRNLEESIRTYLEGKK